MGAEVIGPALFVDPLPATWQRSRAEDSAAPSQTWASSPQPRLDAVVDAAGDVLTMEKRVRLRG